MDNRPWVCIGRHWLHTRQLWPQWWQRLPHLGPVQRYFWVHGSNGIRLAKWNAGCSGRDWWKICMDRMVYGMHGSRIRRRSWVEWLSNGSGGSGGTPPSLARRMAILEVKRMKWIQRAQRVCPRVAGWLERGFLPNPKRLTPPPSPPHGNQGSS